MTQRPPKGLWPAVTTIERIGVSRLRLYVHYAQDEDLRSALVRFHEERWRNLGGHLRRLSDCLPDLADAKREFAHVAGAESADDYFVGLRAVAVEYGLDRIPMVGTPPLPLRGYLPSGIAQAHRFIWRLDRALASKVPLAAMPVLPAERRPDFVVLASFGTPIPALNMSISGSNMRWNPRTELLADARRRLRKGSGLTREAIESELARIARDGGYEFPDTSTERGGIWRLERNAEWVWWRIRRRPTYEQIARDWERLHPGDFRLQYRLDDDGARTWTAANPREAGSLMVPSEAVELVRKAVRLFAERARVDIRTGPGPRASRPGP